MGEGTKIEWCDHTFNPWWGCQRVSPGCEKCYAETFAKRLGKRLWGPTAERRFFGDAHWAEPLKWAATARKEGVRRRVFCASMADVFEDRRDLDGQRERLWRVIEATPELDWLLLTKRPENLKAMLPWEFVPWPNVWIGCTAEDQQRADKRIPLLLEAPAAVRFVSAEPLLGPIDFRCIPANYPGAEGDMLDSLGGAEWFSTDYPLDGFSPKEPVRKTNRLDWVIVGSESNHGARPMDVSWAIRIVRDCEAAGVAPFTKQIATPEGKLHGDPKGGDPQWWPVYMPREFPR